MRGSGHVHMHGSGQADCGVHMRGFGHVHLRGTHTFAWYTYICVVHIHMRGSGQVHMRGFGHVHMRGTRTYAWYTYICVVLAKQTVASEVCDKAVVVV